MSEKKENLTKQNPEFAEGEILESIPAGWFTMKALMVDLKSTPKFLGTQIELIRHNNPEWVKKYSSNVGGPKVLNCYAPELKKAIEARLQLEKDIPPGWESINSLTNKLKVGYVYINNFLKTQRKNHPEWFKKFRHKVGTPAEYLAPELVKIITEQTERYERAPAGWFTVGFLRKKLDADSRTINKIINRYRPGNSSWFKIYYDAMTKPREHLAPELVEILTKELSKIEPVPEGWLTLGELIESVNERESFLKKIGEPYRVTNPEWFKLYKHPNHKVFEYYAPELVSKLNEELAKRPREIPIGWMNRHMIQNDYEIQYAGVEKIIAPYRLVNPEWFRRLGKGVQGREYFSPELVQKIEAEVKKREKPLPGWEHKFGLSRLTGVDSGTLGKFLNRYRATNSDWIRNFYSKQGILEYYSPELVSIVVENFRERASKKKAKEYEQKIENELKSEVENIATNPELLTKFKLWVSLFGGHAAVDILFAHNPKYRGVKEEYVKGIIADYLGDVLVQPAPFNPVNVNVLEKRFLENPNLQEGLYTCLVQACSSYLTRQKANRETAVRVLEDFMLEIGHNVPEDSQDLFLNIIEKVALYFRGIFDQWKKPENMISEITEGRDFPDTAQIINILEIKEKQRMLIADRMGVGKSASVIAAKEYLGLRQALVIVPANVIPTWLKYLSAQKDGGYFIDGKEPEVLVVSSLEDLEGEKVQSADYVIISQERLNEEYQQALQKLNSEMLIVDEVHKLKSTTGDRSKVLHELAQKFENKESYVALLSGTPAPNKVSDMAGILKLLYPERFRNQSVKSIASRIIQGDITDLRALLVPRMQRKTLSEVVDMPQLIESEINVDISDWQLQAYEAILQDDELTSSQKIIALRQFLINPAILEFQPPPEKRPAKIESAENRIIEHIEAGREKVVVIFNDYVSGVTQGEGSVVEQINLPAGSRREIIDGSTPMERRKELQDNFNNSQGVFVLYLSGNTADVGIDLSGAHAAFEYNEPWSKETKAQQIGRSYRPGLKNDLYADTSITRGSIEEGINRYIEIKDKAIQKLLIGVELSDLEKRILEEDDNFSEENFEVDPGLATYYLNRFQDLLTMFKSVKNIGETKFSEFLAKHGDRYAGNYEALGTRSYQNNVARLNANIIKQIIGGGTGEGVVLDLASGPEMLKNSFEGSMRKQVVSLDINPSHFLSVTKDMETSQRKPETGNAVVGGITNLPVGEKKISIVNLALALHYTSYKPSTNDFERLRVFSELNRVLEKDGKAIITLQRGTHLKDPEAFESFVKTAGFEIDTNFTGLASAENFEAEVYSLIKKEDSDYETLVDEISTNKTLAEGLKLKYNGKGKSIRDTRKILTQVKLGEKILELELNSRDKSALAEEKEINDTADVLKSLHGEIKNIPSNDLRQHKFSRLKLNNRYILFKNLEKSGGVVLIKP